MCQSRQLLTNDLCLHGLTGETDTAPGRRTALHVHTSTLLEHENVILIITTYPQVTIEVSYV